MQGPQKSLFFLPVLVTSCSNLTPGPVVGKQDAGTGSPTCVSFGETVARLLRAQLQLPHYGQEREKRHLAPAPGVFTPAGERDNKQGN